MTFILQFEINPQPAPQMRRVQTLPTPAPGQRELFIYRSGLRGDGIWAGPPLEDDVYLSIEKATAAASSAKKADAEEGGQRPAGKSAAAKGVAKKTAKKAAPAKKASTLSGEEGQHASGEEGSAGEEGQHASGEEGSRLAVGERRPGGQLAMGGQASRWSASMRALTTACRRILATTRWRDGPMLPTGRSSRPPMAP